jgi:hypothetical protein
VLSQAALSGQVIAAAELGLAGLFLSLGLSQGDGQQTLLRFQLVKVVKRGKCGFVVVGQNGLQADSRQFRFGALDFVQATSQLLLNHLSVVTLWQWLTPRKSHVFVFLRRYAFM